MERCGENMEAYGDFASVYDEFMDNTPYEEWAERLDGFIQKYGISGKRDVSTGGETDEERLWYRYIDRTDVQ